MSANMWPCLWRDRSRVAYGIMNTGVHTSMKAVEFESTVVPGGQIALPPDVASEIPAGERLRVVVVWEPSNFDLAWRFHQTAGAKIRPALVLLDTGDDDFIAAPITSQLRHSDYDLAIKDWRAAGLNVPSYARVHKLTVLAKADIVRSLARVTGGGSRLSPCSSLPRVLRKTCRRVVGLSPGAGSAGKR